MIFFHHSSKLSNRATIHFRVLLFCLYVRNNVLYRTYIRRTYVHTVPQSMMYGSIREVGARATLTGTVLCDDNII